MDKETLKQLLKELLVVGVEMSIECENRSYTKVTLTFDGEVISESEDWTYAAGHSTRNG